MWLANTILIIAYHDLGQNTKVTENTKTLQAQSLLNMNNNTKENSIPSLEV